jgi:hypothetical protein
MIEDWLKVRRNYVVAWVVTGGLILAGLGLLWEAGYGGRSGQNGGDYYGQEVIQK